jgi:hypothetical protein
MVDKEKFAERVKVLWQQALLHADDFPEVPPCAKCGRVILCGVNKMCSDVECPSKAKSIQLRKNLNVNRAMD